MQMPDKNRWSLIPDIGLPPYVYYVACAMWFAFSFGFSWALDLSYDTFFHGALGGVCSLHYIGKRLAGKSILVDTNLEVSGSSPFHVRFFCDLLFILMSPSSLYILLRG